MTRCVVGQVPCSAVFVQLYAPGCGFIQGSDLGEVERELVDRSSRVGAWVCGGVAAYHALGVDEAALDLGARPACFDCAGGALAAVDDGDQGCGDAFEEVLVVAGGFVGAPVPGDDVVQGGGNNETSACGVGAVKEDLVVDPAVVSDRGIRHIDKPASRKLPFYGGAADSGVFCVLPQGGGRCAVLDELSKHRCVSEIAAGFGG